MLLTFTHLFFASLRQQFFLEYPTNHFSFKKTFIVFYSKIILDKSETFIETFVEIWNLNFFVSGIRLDWFEIEAESNFTSDLRVANFIYILTFELEFEWNVAKDLAQTSPFDHWWVPATEIIWLIFEFFKNASRGKLAREQVPVHSTLTFFLKKHSR